jgi:pimeloyl-ACP methyl ester carboxylesterase
MEAGTMMNAQKSRCGLAYFRLGQGHPLLLLHGIPGSGATWLKVAKELTADFDVVVPDLLGFGGSDRPIDFDSLNATAQADTLSRFLDELGIRSIALAGHDFGGPVALLLHAQRPETVSPAFPCDVAVAREARRIASVFARLVASNAMARNWLPAGHA